MKVTRKMVEYLCELARIEFEEDEYDDIVKDLQGVVDSFEILDEIENIDSLKFNAKKINAENDLREDVAKEGLTVEDVIKNAPENCGGAIVVPKIVE